MLPGVAGGGGSASELDKQFSKVAKETGEGLKNKLKYVQMLRSRKQLG